MDDGSMKRRNNFSFNQSLDDGSSPFRDRDQGNRPKKFLKKAVINTLFWAALILRGADDPADDYLTLAGLYQSCTFLVSDCASLLEQSYVQKTCSCIKWSLVICRDCLVKSDQSPMKSGFVSSMWLSLMEMWGYRPGSRKSRLLLQILRAISNLPPEGRKPSIASKKFKPLKIAIEDRRLLIKKR